METRKVRRPNFEKHGGLVTVVVQNYDTGRVLIVGSANEEAWRKTLSTSKATLWSKSRKKLWTKGEESGNFMQVIDVRVDCDGDALIYKVRPLGGGVACHTGAESCFFRSVLIDGLDESAPVAGPDEELSEVGAEVHEDLV